MRKSYVRCLMILPVYLCEINVKIWMEDSGQLTQRDMWCCTV